MVFCMLTRYYYNAPCMRQFDIHNETIEDCGQLQNAQEYSILRKITILSISKEPYILQIAMTSTSCVAVNPFFAFIQKPVKAT